MNCLCDGDAKEVIWGLEGEELPLQEVFPLEPIAIFIGGEKMTSDTGDTLRFWAQRQIAREYYAKKNILTHDQFDEVARKKIYDALHEVPRMFGIWACKQVMNIAGTNANQAIYKKDHDPRCPSCTICVETCEHVLYCEEEGRVDALGVSIDLMDRWLRQVGTDNGLRCCLVEYAKGRGGLTMEDIARGKGQRLEHLAISQDKIGWRRFMEGMITKEIPIVQKSYADISGSALSTVDWSTGLVTKLLETTHGQWLYRNVQVHDSVTGVDATLRKEELQRLIEEQIELGGGGLEEEDKYLLEINLEDLATTNGEVQTYWLLAIRAARDARTLRENENRRTTAALTIPAGESL